MTREALAIALVNVLMALLGLGLLPLLRIARNRRELLGRAPLAYGLGIAVTGVLGSALELVRAPLGALELAVLAAAALVGGGVKLATASRDDGRRRPPPSRLSLAVGLGGVALALVLLAHAIHASAVRPLRMWDGWVIWATKARALYEHGGVRDAVFANTAYEHPDYPILLPTLEAIGFRAIGEFDGVHLHLVLCGLALAFVAAAWTICRSTSSPAVTGLAILAAMSAPAVLNQLGWAYADVPLGLLSALGVAALAAWLRERETWLLTTATVFLAAAGSTKSEGLVFALAAFLAVAAVAAVTARERLVPILVALAAFAAAILPWRIYVLVHDLRPQDYELSNLASPSYLVDSWDRVGPAARELLSEMASRSEWGLVPVLALFALATALLRNRLDVAGFATLWFVASFGGLLVIYWISTHTLDDDLSQSSYRTIVSLLLGSTLLVPPLVGDDP